MVRDLGRVTLCTSYSEMREGRAKNHSFVSKTNKQTNKQIKHPHHKLKCGFPNQVTLKHRRHILRTNLGSTLIREGNFKLKEK